MHKIWIGLNLWVKSPFKTASKPECAQMPQPFPSGKTVQTQFMSALMICNFTPTPPPKKKRRGKKPSWFTNKLEFKTLYACTVQESRGRGFKMTQKLIAKSVL